ncbi:hypothetical protein [Iodidimonas sp. SYSU 1G8]|uniref:hypothetical protein n=1 Tax=Iodidimonas sp. SYSU 1G8 TaxID=3133967 RepID=UPI0031FE57C6
MSWLGKEMIVESLRELASRQLQEARWLSDGSSDISSFTEAVEQLFTDSGLGDSLQKRETGFSHSVEDELRELDAMLSKIDSDRAPNEIIADPKMGPIREKSGRILEIMRS